MGRGGAEGLTADRCLLDSNPESKRGEAPAAPGFYRSCASRRTMGSAHRAGWFKGECCMPPLAASLPMAAKTKQPRLWHRSGDLLEGPFMCRLRTNFARLGDPLQGLHMGNVPPSVACGDVCSTGKGSCDFQVAMLPYKSRSPATPEGEIFTTLNFELLMRVKVERRVNFPLRGKSPQGNRGAFPTPAGRLFGFLFRGAEL